MQRKAKTRKTTKKKNTFIKKLLVLLSPLFLIFLLLIGELLYYQSRAIPNPGNDAEVTVLPNDVARVLGESTALGKLYVPYYRVPILLYHYVEYVQNDPGKQLLNIPPNILTQQIETLKDAGYTFITPADIFAALFENKKLPQHPIILSFDDGYMDFYTYVYPILQKERVKAVEYVIVNFLDRPNYLSTQQLEAVSKSPLVEIGAHTMDHYALAGMATSSATFEIAQSRKDLQEMLHLPIKSFAYPYGSFNNATIQIVSSAGFTTAVSTIPGIMQSKDNVYFLYRLRPGYRTGQVLLNFLKQDTFQPW